MMRDTGWNQSVHIVYLHLGGVELQQLTAGDVTGHERRGVITQLYRCQPLRDILGRPLSDRAAFHLHTRHQATPSLSVASPH